MRMPKGKWCKLHKSFFCCGRENQKSRMSNFGKHKPRPRYGEPTNHKWEDVGRGEWRIEDPHHPRGYRVRLSKGRMAQLLMDKVVEQDRKCLICHETFDDMREVTPNHNEPSSMGGAWRDDSPDNISAVHGRCNTDLGSRRLPEQVA